MAAHNENTRYQVILSCGHRRGIRKQFLTFNDKEYYCLRCDKWYPSVKKANRIIDGA